jgi:hypothetical protein
MKVGDATSGVGRWCVQMTVPLGVKACTCGEERSAERRGEERGGEGGGGWRIERESRLEGRRGEGEEGKGRESQGERSGEGEERRGRESQGSQLRVRRGVERREREVTILSLL